MLFEHYLAVVVLAQTAFNHLFHHIVGLTRFFSLLSEQRTLAPHLYRIKIVTSQRLWPRRGHMHRELLAKSYQRGLIGYRTQRHENTDLAEIGHDTVVHVADDGALIHRQAITAAQH